MRQFASGVPQLGHVRTDGNGGLAAGSVPDLPALRDPEPSGAPLAATGTWVEGLTGEVRRQSPADQPITALMTRDVACLSRRATAAEAAEQLLELGVSGAPVIDERGRPIGMVTRGDLMRELLRGAGGTRVADCMTNLVLSVPMHASVARAAALMAYEGVHRILITDERGRLVGLVSALDVARWVAEHAGYRHLFPPRDWSE